MCYTNTITSSHSHSASIVCFSNRIRRGRSEPLTAAGPDSQQQQQQQQQQHRQPQQSDGQQQQSQEQQPQEQQPICIALGTTSAAAAKAILVQLRSYGSAEVWATSSANHFTALQALAEAHCQLAGSSQQHQHHHGLAATAQLSASDQAVADDQKRGLRKLTLHVKPASLGEEVWTPGAANHLSTNRTRAVAELVEAMQLQLGSPSSTGTEASSSAGAAAAGGSSSSSCGCVVLEARGEQAVTRALKAVLSVQAVQPGTLLLAPWAGPVVDVVAEKRGEQRLAGGLLLHVSWQCAAE
ncbi:hypothetical protein COO60DRAFT_1558748 [Scenedesmus sp. NREL 46B-D3]|nr:hypothetical protein COO60DRAFT_1558748 [Scenedesmus sp. NREL 46B-D3]